MGGIVRRLTRRTLQRASRAVYLCLLLWAWFAPTQVSAASFEVTAESDWYFSVEQDDTLVVIYGNSNESCNEVTTDPYLWLYDDAGTLIAQDDDGNHNANDQCVSSKIYTTLKAGEYRLRAGYCCSQLGLGNTMSWGDGTYELLTDFGLNGTTTTTSSTTTTTTTTVVPSTTTSTVVTSTTSTIPQTTSTTTTTVAPTTTTTTTPSTTTVPTTTTSSSTTTSTTTAVATTSTTSTTAPTTTTTQPPVTTSTSTTSSTVPPVVSVAPVTSTTTSTSSSTTTTSQPTTTTTTTTPAASPSTSSTPSTTVWVDRSPTTSTTTLQPSVEVIAGKIEDIKDAEAVAAVLDGDVSSEDIQQLAEVDIEKLPEEAVQAILETLNNSSEEIKNEFQESVNVFSGEIDAYIPSGSNVSVGERRTIIAVTATVASPVSPIPTRRRKV